MNNELVSILRAMAAGRTNQVGDYWGMYHCNEAAELIEFLQGEVAMLEVKLAIANEKQHFREELITALQNKA